MRAPDKVTLVTGDLREFNNPGRNAGKAFRLTALGRLNTQPDVDDSSTSTCEEAQ
jgi:hypothetical protein